MAKLQITSEQKAQVVDAVDELLHSAFADGVEVAGTPPVPVLDRMQFFKDRLTAEQQALTKDTFKLVIAALANLLNLKPVPPGFTGEVEVLTPSSTATFQIENGYVTGVAGEGGGDGGITTLTVDCQITDAVGDLVIFTAGANRTVRRVDSTNANQMPAIAVIKSKPTSTTATIQLSGPVEGVYSGLTPGARYYVDGNGRPNTNPLNGITLGTEFCLQVVGVAADATTLLLIPTADFAQILAE